jgi:hypothetical protein
MPPFTPGSSWKPGFSVGGFLRRDIENHNYSLVFVAIMNSNPHGFLCEEGICATG